MTSNEVESLIEFEKAIQWRWSTGDPTGYMDVLAEDVTYFDPIAEYLVVGRKALLEHWERIYRDAHITRQEYLNEVAHPNEKGDEVVLAYKLQHVPAGRQRRGETVPVVEHLDRLSKDRRQVADRAWELGLAQDDGCR